MALQKPLYNDPTTLYDKEFSPTADEMALARVTLNGIGGIGLVANNNSITGVADPVNPQDVVNLRSLNIRAAGFSVKTSVAALATTNITLSGAQTVDTYAVTAGQRVFVTGQTNGPDNGIYDVQTGAWTRSSDFPVGSHAVGWAAFVEFGTNYKNEFWACNSAPGSDVVGTNTLTFAQANAVPELTVSGTGISYSSGNLTLNYGPGIAAGASGITAQVDGGAIVINGSNQISLKTKSGGPLTNDPTNGLTLTAQSGVLDASGSTLNLVGLPTTAGLNLLYQNNYADTVHKHSVVKAVYTNGSNALAKGVPVFINSAGQLQASDAAATTTAIVIGVTTAAIAANATGEVALSGSCAGCLTGATAGAQMFLAVGGGLTATAPSASGNVVYAVGFASAATDLALQFRFVTVRA